MMLKVRFRKAQTLLGTQKILCVIPASETKFKVFSEANVFNTTHIVHLQDEDIRGFETCKCDKKWWLACVTSE
jgi:hypothetical protein